jgi:hypothetical protein
MAFYVGAGVGGFPRRQPVRYLGPPRPPDVADAAARARRKPPAQMPPAVQPMPYTNPTQQQQQIYHQAGGPMTGPGYAGGDLSPTSPEYDPALAVAHEQAKQAVQAAAARYGTMRMNQLQNVQNFLPPELQQQVQGVSMVDPAAAWRSVSGAFTQAAMAAGFQDPRLYLTSLLNRPRVQGPLPE